jgi:hypothetical protein
MVPYALSRTLRRSTFAVTRWLRVNFAGVLASAALQEAVVPPFVPWHDQYHGPLPVTVDAVPVLQRFVVGMLERVAPLLVPQVPLVGVGADSITHV